ncbi:MAG: 50S ribosomal protein L32 [bacterium]|nr:50S ribosomal protein L32 [bacterium]
MGSPRRRVSRSRSRKGRTHWKFVPPQLIPCPNCKTLILPHTRCYNCGNYKGKEAIAARAP